MKMFSNRCPQMAILIVSVFLLISCSFSAPSQNVEKKICQTEQCLAAAKNFKESMNFDVDPCDDFYKYACGNWSQSSNESRSTMLSRKSENNLEILDFLKRNNSKDEPKAVHKARKFFALCMNQTAYKNDLQQIETMLGKIGIPIDSFNSSEIENFDYSIALAKADILTGARLYFDISVLANPHNKTAETIWLSVHNSNPYDKYKEIKRMCENATSSTSCNRLILLLDWANNSTTNETVNSESKLKAIPNLFHPVVFSLKQLQNLTDAIAAEVNATISTLNWTRYFEELIIDRDNATTDFNDPQKLKIIIDDLDSVKGMIKHVHMKQNMKIIAYEFLREVVYTLQPYVDSTSRKEMSCMRNTDDLFSWAISYMYATREKHIKAKAEVPVMIEHLREIFQQLIQQSSWMDEITKQKALKKLQLMWSHIAYPNIIANASSLDNFYKDVQITDNFYDTVFSMNRRALEKFDDWTISPNNVEAFNEPDTNTIYILAGILDFPYYNTGLDALNYGAIGSAMGHEIAHALDNNGRRYNEVGDMEDWWQSKTADLFKEKARCFVEANRKYNSTITNGSESTQKEFNSRNLGEDLADNVGFKESLLAYRKYVSVSKEQPFLPQFENFTHEQLLTLSYANMWCENQASAISGRDEHSVYEFRINGVFQNSKEFSKIWKCPKNSKMNPNEKCELW